MSLFVKVDRAVPEGDERGERDLPVLRFHARGEEGGDLQGARTGQKNKCQVSQIFPPCFRGFSILDLDWYSYIAYRYIN